MDRALPFPGWTLPGVFTLGGAQIALKAQGCPSAVASPSSAPGRCCRSSRINMPRPARGSSPCSMRRLSLRRSRSCPGMIAAPATLVKGLWYTARNRMQGLRIRYGVRGHPGRGPEAGRGARLSRRVGSGASDRIATRSAPPSASLSETQLADLAGCAFVFDSLTRQWLPERTPEGRSSVPGIYLAGDGAGIGGADRGGAAGPARGAGRARGPRPPGRRRRDGAARRRACPAGPLPRSARARLSVSRAPPRRCRRRARSLCRCEGITAGALRDAARDKGSRRDEPAQGADAASAWAAARAASAATPPRSSSPVPAAPRSRASAGCAANRRSSRSRVLGERAVTERLTRRRRDHRRRHRRLRRRRRAAPGAG